MSKFPFNYFRMDVHQAAMFIGVLEALSVLRTYLDFLDFSALSAMLDELHESSEWKKAHKSSVYVSSGPFFPNLALHSLIFAFMVLFSLLVSVGAVKSKRWLMLPWLIVGWTRAAYCALAIINMNFMLPLHACILLAETLYALYLVTSSFSLLGRSVSDSKELANSEVIFVHM